MQFESISSWIITRFLPSSFLRSLFSSLFLPHFFGPTRKEEGGMSYVPYGGTSPRHPPYPPVNARYFLNETLMKVEFTEVKLTWSWKCADCGACAPATTTVALICTSRQNCNFDVINVDKQNEHISNLKIITRRDRSRNSPLIEQDKSPFS